MRGSVDGHFGYFLYVQICMKKGSMFNHQFSQDWNDLEVAYASRIEPDVNGTFQDCSVSILYVAASTCEITGLVLILNIFRFKDFD